MRLNLLRTNNVEIITTISLFVYVDENKHHKKSKLYKKIIKETQIIKKINKTNSNYYILPQLINTARMLKDEIKYDKKKMK
jgi:hypothetical protein